MKTDDSLYLLHRIHDSTGHNVHNNVIYSMVFHYFQFPLRTPFPNSFKMLYS